MRRRGAAPRMPGPFETRTVTLPVSLFIRGLQLVDIGRFDSFDSAVAAGLELLTRSESAMAERLKGAGNSYGQQGARPRASPAGLPLTAEVQSPHARLPRAPREAVLTSSKASPSRSAWPILGFTAARILPMKAVLRGIAEAAVGQPSPLLDLGSLRSQLGVEALAWRAALEAVDDQRRLARGERLTTGFPSFARDGERSVRRFLDAYLGTFYSDGRVAGAPAYVGFVDMNMNDQGGRVGLTAPGLRFAQLPNSVFDRGEARFPPFSPEEADFYIRHVASAHLAEAEHMGEYLHLLRQRPGVDRDAAGSAMRRFYVRFWTPNNLTPDMVNSLRMSVHSRCQELGLAVADHDGRTAGYRITELGERTLSSLQSLESIPS